MLFGPVNFNGVLEVFGEKGGGVAKGEWNGRGDGTFFFLLCSVVDYFFSGLGFDDPLVSVRCRYLVISIFRLSPVVVSDSW